MNPIIINNFSRRKEFIQMLKYRGAKIGVEVGTDRGQYAKQLLEGIPGLGLDCIDPYLAYTEGNDTHTQKEMDQIYKEAKERIKPYNSLIIRTTSMEAVKEFTDDSLDFVFIDGNHSYQSVLEDITEWTEKVKPGGVIVGHDYTEDKVRNYGVIEAVNKYVKDNDISPLLILHGGGKLADCWMIFKQ